MVFIQSVTKEVSMLVSAITRASLHPALIRLPVSCSLHTSPVTRAKLYSAKHEWVELVGGADSDTVRVGVTRYAAEALGDVVYAQLPREEEELEAGGEAGAVESVKAASELYSPVSGTVTQHNIQVRCLLSNACYLKSATILSDTLARFFWCTMSVYQWAIL